MGGAARLEVVPLGSIVGTIEPTPHFDADFRPASNVVRHRWERVALAYRRGVALPPVVLRARDDGYYVVDGRHRVSVARALGLEDIDGWVTGARPSVRFAQPEAQGAVGVQDRDRDPPALTGRCQSRCR
jgi:ParB-like nuclease domain